MFLLYNHMLSSIKNGIIKKKIIIECFYNNLCLLVLIFLKKKGYINGYSIISKKKIRIFLKYITNRSVINNIKQLTTSKKRIYQNLKKIRKFCFLGWDYVYLTPTGIFDHTECVFLKKGGLLLFQIN